MGVDPRTTHTRLYEASKFGYLNTVESKLDIGFRGSR